MNVQLDGDDYDNAYLRLCSAKAMITTLSTLMVRQKNATITTNSIVLSEALYGIESLLEDCNKLLSKVH